MKRILIFFVGFIFISNIAFAENVEDKAKPSILGKSLDETLSSFKEILTPYYRLDPIVITPTRYEDPSLNVSSNVSVIDEKRIGECYPKYVPDLLRDEAGVVVSDLLGNGKAVRVDIRGFGDSAPLNVLVLVDGRRTNQIDLSGADWIQIDPAAIERIEVVRGPQTVLYGDNATAGVVNIVTKSGAKKKPAIGFIYDVGSYRYSSWKGYIEGGSNFLDYFAMASTSYNNGYRINNDLETVDYNAKVTMKPDENFKLTSSAAYHKDRYGQPGAVKPADINRIGRRGSINPDDRAKTEDYYYMLTPEITKDLSFGEVTLSGDALFRSRSTSSASYFTGGSNFITHLLKTIGFTPKAAFIAEIFGIKNRLMGGFDYYGSIDKIRSGYPSAPDTIIIDKKTGGVYLTDTVELPFQLIADAGVRTEWAYYKFDQQAVGHSKNQRWPFEYACEAGLTYKYNDRSSIYGRYSRSFRFPTTEEWYQSLWVDSYGNVISGGLNLGLEPQTANNYEIGIKENSSKYINVNANYHIMDVNDELFYDPLVWQNSIYNHTLHHGLNLETDFYLLDCVRAFFNYTYQRALFVGDKLAGNEIPLVPRNKISTGIKYTLKDCFNVVYSIDYVGARRFANDVRNDMPDLKEHIVHNIKFSYYKYGFEVYGAINNIFNTEYTEYGALDFYLTNPGYYPSPRLNGSMGIRYKF
ncbi:MAG: TonB-dependent receptor [Candidatus Omnitrophota bacterium]